MLRFLYALLIANLFVFLPNAVALDLWSHCQNAVGRLSGRTQHRESITYFEKNVLPLIPPMPFNISESGASFRDVARERVTTALQAVGTLLTPSQRRVFFSQLSLLQPRSHFIPFLISEAAQPLRLARKIATLFRTTPSPNVPLILSKWFYEFSAELEETLFDSSDFNRWFNILRTQPSITIYWSGRLAPQSIHFDDRPSPDKITLSIYRRQDHLTVSLVVGNEIYLSDAVLHGYASNYLPLLRERLMAEDHKLLTSLEELKEALKDLQANDETAKQKWRARFIPNISLKAALAAHGGDYLAHADQARIQMIQNSIEEGERELRRRFDKIYRAKTTIEIIR